MNTLTSVLFAAMMLVIVALFPSCTNLDPVECVSNDDCNAVAPYCCGASGAGAFCYSGEELPFACGGPIYTIDGDEGRDTQDIWDDVSDTMDTAPDGGDTMPDAVITDATDADGDTSPDAEDTDVSDTADTEETTPDVIITDATDADGDTSPDVEDVDVTDTTDSGDTTPDVIITDATDADGDSSPDAEDADVHEETSDTGDTSLDVIITDATDADGDTSPDAEDADVTDTTDSGDTTPDTEIPDTTPVCGDGICEGDEEDCEADCGPRIVTLTVNVHPNDDAWIHRLLGVPNRIRIERYNPFDDAWEFVGYPGQVLPTSPGEEFRIITTVPSLIFGSCASNYTVPDDCTSCDWNTPRMIFDINRNMYEGIPGRSEPIRLSRVCVSNPTIPDIVRQHVSGCRGDGDIFQINSQWVCLQPLGELNGSDNRRGVLFSRCTEPDTCPDYVEASFNLNNWDRITVVTTLTTYTLIAR